MLELITALLFATGLTVNDPSVIISENGTKTILVRIDNNAIKGSIEITKLANQRAKIVRNIITYNDNNQKEVEITQSIIMIDENEF